MCCRQCVSNQVPWIGCQQYDNVDGNGNSRVQTIFWSREAEHYTLVQYTTRVPEDQHCGPVSSPKSHTATFSRDCMLHLSFVMGTSMNFFSRESTMSTITVSQRETQTGHQIGHCSMPRRCRRGARWHQRWRSSLVVLDGIAILYMLNPAAAGTFCESSMMCSYHNV